VPSSVTTRVQHLEAALGVRLFVRERQRLHLSAEGERLLAYADRLLRLADEARSAVAGLPGGVLRLGALESTTASRLPAVLARFHRVCPDVRVELITGTNDVLTAAVAGCPFATGGLPGTGFPSHGIGRSRTVNRSTFTSLFGAVSRAAP